MAFEASNKGPQNVPAPAPGGGVQIPPTTEKLQQLFDNGIWYALGLWPALTVACQNGWGGEDTADKRDWFAGAISELFSTKRDTDQDDVEVFLLQIMQDEFDCNVEDDSEVEVAGTIVALRKSLMERNLSYAQQLERRWQNRGQMKTDIKIIDNGVEADDDEDWEGLSEEDGDDVDMEPGEAPKLVPAVVKSKPEPEVDDDGFTKVVGKKR